MVTDLILVSVLKDTGFVTMGKHVNVSYYSATQSDITHIEEICKVGLDCLNVAVQCNFKWSRISRGHISSLLSYLPAVCQYLGYARPSKMVLNAYF